jgi:hypothetical protein
LQSVNPEFVSSVLLPLTNHTLDILRDDISNKLHELGVEKLYLPQLTTVNPNVQSVPIYVSEPDKLRFKKRIVLVIPSQGCELEVLTSKGLFGEEGIEDSSPIGIAKEIGKDGDAAPGLIVANTAQLLYSHVKHTALSVAGWNNRIRPSMIHQPQVVLPDWNYIRGHEDAESHIRWIFENLLKNRDFVGADAKIDIVAVRQSATSVFEYLDVNCE